MGLLPRPNSFVFLCDGLMLNTIAAIGSVLDLLREADAYPAFCFLWPDTEGLWIFPIIFPACIFFLSAGIFFALETKELIRFSCKHSRFKLSQTDRVLPVSAARLQTLPIVRA